MRPVLVRAIPVVIAVVALVHEGCGSRSSERAPTGPGPELSRTGSVEGRVTALAVPPSLGAATSFAVLAGSTVTNTGPTVVNGDLGVSPGMAITGFPPGTVNGSIHAADAAALAAQNSVTTAYNQLAGQACDTDLTGQDLGGLTLTPGAYCFSSSAFLTGTLTLNAQGNSDAVWVFQIGSTLITASGSRVVIVNGGQECGAFWQVGSSATLGTNSTFRGNVLALTSITATTGARSFGALFARNAAVTLDSNQVNQVGSCGSSAPVGVPALSPGAEWILLVVLLGVGAYVLSRP